MKHVNHLIIVNKLFICKVILKTQKNTRRQNEMKKKRKKAHTFGAVVRPNFRLVFVYMGRVQSNYKVIQMSDNLLIDILRKDSLKGKFICDRCKDKHILSILVKFALQCLYSLRIPFSIKQS